VGCTRFAFSKLILAIFNLGENCQNGDSLKFRFCCMSAGRFIVVMLVYFPGPT
jgi:hypothetical protein